MASLWSRTNHWLTWLHRWAGVVLCLLFAMWFATGAVLHFIGFPSLSHAEQVAASEPIDLSRIQVAPSTAFAAEPAIDDWRLVSVDGEPVYLGTPDTGAAVAIAADSGRRLPLVSRAVARQVAEKFAGKPAREVAGPIDYDQWVVHQQFDALRPLYRAAFSDGAGTELYVSARTGEVVQVTRRFERAWNWCGAVTHWIYFTALRKSWSAWNQVVWWLALAGLLTSVIGTWLGILRYARNRSAGRPGLSPFRGWLRWHHIIGLFASVFVVSWILSGWLSMDHGRIFSYSEPTATQVSAVRGLDAQAIARFATPAALKQLAPASVIHFHAIAGRPVLTAEGPGAATVRTLWADSAAGATLGNSLPDSLLLAGLARAWTASAVPAKDSAFDRLYRRAESTPADAAGFLIGGASGTRVYLDRHTGRIVALLDSSRRSYAWIYYALHTLQFPWLLDHEGARTVLVLVLLALGFGFSVTGVVIGVLRLRHQALNVN
jgi:hypothetical protein